MLRSSFLIALVCGVFAITASAASIDGTWVSKRTMKRQGQERTITTTFNLKSAGSQLTGTVTTAFGQRERTVDIQNGKIEGNAFSFTTVQKGRQGQEMKILWKGTVEGDQLKGEAGPEGRRARPFTAKRQ